MSIMRINCSQTTLHYLVSISKYSYQLKHTIMEIIGRITKDAVVRTVKKSNRSVVSFTIAINDYYKPKDAEKGIKITTYIDCNYWLSSSVAKVLVQGALVELHGRIYATAYMSKDNEPKASINCHVNSFKLHSTVQREKVKNVKQEEPADAGGSDLPF
jgi:single-strand DNA-binding protein